MKKKIREFIEDYEPQTVVMILALAMILFKLIDLANHI